MRISTYGNIQTLHWPQNAMVLYLEHRVHVFEKNDAHSSNTGFTGPSFSFVEQNALHSHSALFIRLFLVSSLVARFLTAATILGCCFQLASLFVLESYIDGV